MKTKNLIIGSAAAAGVFAASAFAISDNLIQLKEYTLDTGKLTAPIRAAVLSDMHFSVFGKDNIRLVNAVRRANADIILLAGDFFDFHGGKSNAAIAIKTLRQLSAICPTYFVPGNHDYRYDAITGESFAVYAREAGCVVLDGEYRDIELRGQRVRVGGIFDHGCCPEDYGRLWKDSPVYAFLKELQDTDSLKLAVMHRPNTFIYTCGRTGEDWNIDAVFSGHDHGGVWRLPVIGGIYAAEQGLFPKYDKGVYTFGRMKMFLSTGLEGYYRIPRLFNRPEVLCLTIK